MNKPQAQKTLAEFFEHEFHAGRFTTFTAELFNLRRADMAKKSFECKGNYVPDSFRKWITSYRRLAQYNIDDDTIVDILIVQLGDDDSLERARTMQRNFIARYLNGGRGDKLRDAALVAYVSANQQNWRLSLVTMDYKLEHDLTGRVKLKESATPARRASFLVGEGEGSHTAQSRFIDWLTDDQNAPTLAQLKECFNIEKVTGEFYDQYLKLYHHLNTALQRLTHNHPAAKDFAAKKITTDAFAKKLLGQIVFLYFIQKKGWFGVQKDQQWGAGPRNFMRRLFNKEYTQYRNFFTNVLEPFFYGALCQQRPGDYYAPLKCRIPFLNGGLFDPIGGYDWQKNPIPLPNTLFSNTHLTTAGDTGDGILDIFDRYNFTVKEDEPLEKDVAVDPEMLGKVFENMLNAGDRKSKGAFYTPREIVHYMCRESLTHHLNATLAPKLPQKDIALLIAGGDAFIEHDSRVINAGRETKTYAQQLPKTVSARARQIDAQLANIAICDPAVGSGAFAVGMMNEIIRIRQALTPHLPTPAAAPESRTPYALKHHAIAHSLYGVDIDPAAVEIAKLRLWLSLVVDEAKQSAIHPLPNLDYKIVRGNSLLSAENQLLTHPQFEKLRQLMSTHFNETDPAKKIAQKNGIDNLIRKLTDGRRQFNFEIYFPEVFHKPDKAKNGFDLIIANPPYVRAGTGGNSQEFRAQLKELGLYETLYEKWDLMVPFIEKGIKTTNKNGILTYIVSDSICTVKYGHKLLEWLQANFYPYAIDYFNNVQVFDAGVTPVVIQLGKKRLYATTTKNTRQDSFANIADSELTPIDQFKSRGREGFRKGTANTEPSAPSLAFHKLGDICYISKGLTANSNNTSHKGIFRAEDIISDMQDHVHSMPFVEGKNLKEYQIQKVRYLEWGTDRVPSQLNRKTFPELYSCPKILRGRVTGATYDDSGIACGDGVTVCIRFTDLSGVNNKSISGSITKNNKHTRTTLEKTSEQFHLKYILAILNSAYAYGFLRGIQRHRIPDYFYPGDLRELPIATIPPQDQQPFVELVDKILTETSSPAYPESPQKQQTVKTLKTELNQRVNTLYGKKE